MNRPWRKELEIPTYDTYLVKEEVLIASYIFPAGKELDIRIKDSGSGWINITFGLYGNEALVLPQDEFDKISDKLEKLESKPYNPSDYFYVDLDPNDKIAYASINGGLTIAKYLGGVEV